MYKYTQAATITIKLQNTISLQNSNLSRALRKEDDIEIEDYDAEEGYR